MLLQLRVRRPNMDSQRPALSPGGPQGLASPPGVWRLEATAISRAEALPAPVGPSWRVWGPVRGRCVRHVSGRGRFELEARPGCLVQAVTQSDEEQMVGAATWLLGGEGDPEAKAAWDLASSSFPSVPSLSPTPSPPPFLLS